LADEEPWKMIKNDQGRVQTQMYVALQIAAALSSLCEPFLPFTAKKLSRILKIENPLSWSAISETSDLIPGGHQIGEAELLFAKIEDEEIQKQIDKLEATKTANKAESKVVEPQKEAIQFDDFSKMDIRVGTILEAEKMPKANKLLILKVDTGIDVRTIVSGIAESFKPEDIVGKKVTVLVNLAPRVLRGVESQGMILMTTNTEGKLVFINPDTEGVANGETIN
jgi:methionyl-tRNA synthetase